MRQDQKQSRLRSTISSTIAPDKGALDDLVRQHANDGVVDVIKLAKTLGLDVFPEDLADANSGYLKATDDGAFIVVNKNHPSTRQRFTVAHEISHFVEHRDALRSHGQLDRNIAKDSDQKIETQADKMAAEILMPASSVTDYIGSLKGDMKLPSIFSTDAIVDIAGHYKVSPAMAVTRLRELGYAVPYVSFA